MELEPDDGDIRKTPDVPDGDTQGMRRLLRDLFGSMVRRERALREIDAMAGRPPAGGAKAPTEE